VTFPGEDDAACLAEAKGEGGPVADGEGGPEADAGGTVAAAINPPAPFNSRRRVTR
jgi:hypothetical protein